MFFRSLQSRIVLLFVTLLVLVQGTALLLANSANERNARDHIRQELAVGERIFRRLLEQNYARLAQAAELLSLDFAFREAVATRDLPTIHSVLINHGARIRADRMALVSLDGQVLADTLEPQRGARPFQPASLLRAAEQHGGATGMQQDGGRTFQVAVLPVLAPTPIAWTVVGFVMDERLAKDLRALSTLDVSFLSQAPDGVSTLLASTVPAELARSLALRDEEYQSAVLELGTAGDARIVAVLSRSVAEAMAPYRRLDAVLIMLLVGSIAASVVASVLIARGVVRPLSQLSAMTRRIEQGDHDQAVEVAGPVEIGDLARRFNLMREAVAARQAEVLKLAYRDTLCDLPNRLLFNDRLSVALEGAKRTGAPVSVLLMDLDRFKHVNDTLGHPMGDRVLQQVAKRLAVLVRKSDTTARLGGDEFAVLLVNAGVDEARGVARKIIAALELPIVVGEHSLDVRTSIGIAGFPVHGADVETLVRYGDTAMYAAKRGNTGLAVYEPHMHEQREEQLTLLSDLRQAIEHGELRLVYQPKIALLGGMTTGVEALVRWKHPSKGMISPDRFIPFAEQTGFIKTITAWVIDAAVRQGAAWQEAGRSIRISVNISAQDLLKPELADQLAGALERHSLPAELLGIEITESGVMQDAARATEVLKGIERLGVGCSIDDFGTGYSSLAYLKLLPVDELKIDRSFIRNIVRDAKDRAIVMSTIGLAHNLGLDVVAEGVEDQPSADLLRELGCDAIQGWLVAKALEPEALETWLPARSFHSVSRIS
jgi:diguanylate cyclase (GGDEF)-like protein